MKKYFFLAGIMFCVLAYATENWTWQYKPLAATFSIYSGELGERQPPTKNERKLAIAIKGDAAKEIFDSLYPDSKDATCTSEDGERLRRKGEVWCSYRPSDGYKCFVGFDLRTGKSIGGGIC